MPPTACTILPEPMPGTVATFGVCNNPNFHGHNYELDITVEGEINADYRLRSRLAICSSSLAEDRVLTRHLDHKNLNLDVAWFASLSPTSENSPSSAGASLAPGRARRAGAAASVSGKHRGIMSTTPAR